MAKSLHQTNLNISAPLQLITLVNKEQLNAIITNKNGTPDYLAINIYYDTLRSWYNPKIGYRKDGNVYHVSKLKTPGIFLDYKRLAQIHGCSKETIRQKIVKLEHLGLVHRSFQHIETVTTKSYNRLIAYVWKDTPHFYNPMGIDIDQVPALIAQTNHEYIERKYGICFASQSPLNKSFCVRRGIQVCLDTKKLNNLILRDIRSDVQTHESIVWQNSNSLILEKKDKQEEVIPKIDTLKVISLKSKPIANKRKKPTNAEIKAKKAKLYKFNQYEQPKSLNEHYPLNKEDCAKLQIASGREFTLNAMNEILLDISRKHQESRHRFPSKAAFMSYMSKVYRYEGRDAVKTANTNFKLLARATEAEIIQHTTQAERENYLNLVEQQAITHRSDENQYRAKLGNRLKPSQAYDFLSNLQAVKRIGAVFELHMAKNVDLTEYSLEMILQEANAVGGYRGVEKLEFIVNCGE